MTNSHSDQDIVLVYHVSDYCGGYGIIPKSMSVVIDILADYGHQLIVRGGVLVYDDPQLTLEFVSILGDRIHMFVRYYDRPTITSNRAILSTLNGTLRNNTIPNTKTYVVLNVDGGNPIHKIIMPPCVVETFNMECIFGLNLTDAQFVACSLMLAGVGKLVEYTYVELTTTLGVISQPSLPH